MQIGERYTIITSGLQYEVNQEPSDQECRIDVSLVKCQGWPKRPLVPTPLSWLLTDSELCRLIFLPPATSRYADGAHPSCWVAANKNLVQKHFKK